MLVIPGFGAADTSTYFLRKFLTNTGLQVYGWKLGKNDGNIGRVIQPLTTKITEISNAYSEPVILIGWSLGGIIARELSRISPKEVRGICCLGSPIIGGPSYTVYAPLLRYLKRDLSKISQIVHKRESVPIRVPSHVIYSKNDGIVHWEACIDSFNAHTTHTEINTPHFSMGTSTELYCELLRWLRTIVLEVPSAST